MRVNNSDLAKFRSRFESRFKFRLQRFGLLGYYEPDDVINEAWLRYEVAVKKGKEIVKFDGWIYITGFNYIRELSRTHKKYKSVEPSKFEFMSLESEQYELVLEETKTFEYSKIREALLQLKPQIREILELKFIQNLSWQDIAQHLASKGEYVTLDTLRKRGERAKKQLKKALITYVQ